MKSVLWHAGKWDQKTLHVVNMPISSSFIDLVIRPDNLRHFPLFFLLKVALSHLQNVYLFFLFKYYMCPCQMLTLQIVEIRVDCSPTCTQGPLWQPNLKWHYSVIGLDNFRIFPYLSFSKFLYLIFKICTFSSFFQIRNRSF